MLRRFGTIIVNMTLDTAAAAIFSLRVTRKTLHRFMCYLTAAYSVVKELTFDMDVE